MISPIRELLCALRGFDGTFIEKNYHYSKSNGSVIRKLVDFRVSDDVKLSVAERAQINEILKCAFWYNEIETFVSLHQYLGNEDEIINSNTFESKHGIFQSFSHQSRYFLALQSALQELLTGYRSLILSIENDVINTEKENDYPLTKLKHSLSNYRIVLHHIYSLINQITDSNGISLVNLVYSRTSHGNPLLRSVYIRLLYHLLRILIGEIQVWSLFGSWKDEEYSIIQKRKGEFDWDFTFHLNANLPHRDLINEELFKKILFCGKCHHVLYSNQKLLQIQQQLVMKYNDRFENLKLQKIWKQSTLASLMNELYGDLNAILWSILVKDDPKRSLLKALEVVKSYFLLFNGEFFSFFFQNFGQLVQKQANKRTLHEAQTIWQKAFDAPGDDDLKKEYEKLSLGLDRSTFEYNTFSQMAYKELRLQGRSRIENCVINIFSSTHKDNYGAVSDLVAQNVEFGFSTKFTFSALLRNQCKLSFAFVLKSSPNFELSTSLKQNSPFCGGLSNAFVIEFLCTDSQITISIWKCPSFHTNQPPICLQDRKLSLIRSLHNVEIRYTPPSEKPGSLMICFDNQIIQLDDFVLSQYLQLIECRAFVGIVATSSNCLDESSLTLQKWSFTPIPPLVLNEWSNLRLSYRVSEHISLLLPAELLQQLNSLFRFLFAFRFVHFQVVNVWNKLITQWRNPLKRTGEETNSVQSERRLVSAFHLNMIFMHFLTQIWMYLQVDGVEALYSEMRLQIDQNCSSFEKLRSLISNFIRLCMTHCSINERILQSAFFKLQTLINEFTRHIQQNDSHLTIDTKLIENIKSKSIRQIKFILTIITNKTIISQSNVMLSKSTSKSLAALVHRLDENLFYKNDQSLLENI